MSPPSLREAMLQAEADLAGKAAATADYWQERPAQRQLRARLAAKLDTSSPTTWRPRPPAYRPAAIERKERHQGPVAIPNSRWQRVDEGTWVRIS